MTASPLINRRDLAFVLYDLLDVGAFTKHARYADHSRETFDAAIETAHRLALDKFHPHNAKADKNEPTFDGNVVSMIPEVGEALAAFGPWRTTGGGKVGACQFLGRSRNGAAIHPRIGSLALRLCRIGDGTLDIAFAGGQSRDWDLAAADLIVHEAGGRMTMLSGEPIGYNRPDVRHGVLVAAGRERHASVITHFRDHPLPWS